MDKQNRTRRNFLKSTVSGAAGLAMINSVNGISKAEGFNKSDSGYRKSDFVKLGVASYSLRKFKRDKAIEIIKECRAKYVSVKAFHLPYEDSPGELAAGCMDFKQAGLEIVGGGVITLKKDDDNDIRKYFEYAKTCGMHVMVIAPTPQTLPRIEKFVKEYNIKVAVHNHGPEDKYFPGPDDVLKVVKDMDVRVGVCLDTGHTTRTGVDIIESMTRTGKRLHDVHIKDLRDLMDKKSQCTVGEGKMPVTAIFRKLEEMEYPGYVNLEYEIKADDPLHGMKESFAYMRGVIDGMG